MASAIDKRGWSRGSLLAGIAPVALLAVVTVVVLALVVAWIEMPTGDLTLLLFYVAGTSLLSCGLGFLAFRLSEQSYRSIRAKFVFAQFLGTLVVIINILVTARLMFISTHDLGLLFLLLAFGALASIVFAVSVAARMSAVVANLATAARQVADGDLRTRVSVDANDELAELADAFNEMVARVDRAAAERERADAARRDLVAAVSHDLRTPLTAMRAILDAIDDGLVDDADVLARYQHTLRIQIDSLSQLTTDLFELAQLETGAAHFEPRRVDLAGEVRAALEGHAMSAARRAMTIELDLPAGIMVDLDPARFPRVLGNVLDNAFRHSPDGSTVEVSVERVGVEARVCVRDYGEGVRDADLPHIFDRFFRGDPSRSRATGGAGLGLAIARGIVDVHGGRIWAEQPGGAGARFVIAVPIADQPA